MTVLVAPSLLAADFGKLREAVKLVEENGADWIHLDIMDGHFVPVITMGPAVVQSLRPHTGLLRCTPDGRQPGRASRRFAAAGADLITVHAEATAHLDRVLRRIKALGVKAGVP